MRKMTTTINVSAVLSDWSSRPFNYEADNCCEFVGEVLQALFGKNPMAGFHYKTKKEALRAIAQHGNLVDAINATLGDCMPFSEPFVQGDVVACLQPDKSWICGVVLLQRIAVKTDQSIMDWPLSRAVHRWRI